MKASELTPLTIPQPFASNGDITAIVDTSTTVPNFSTGVPEIFSSPHSKGGSYFQRSMMNAIGNMASKNAFYRQCGGFYCFDKTVSDKIGGYPKGCVLHWLKNGQYLSVQSLVDNNTYDFVTNGIDGVNWALCDTGNGMWFPNYASENKQVLVSYSGSLSTTTMAIAENFTIPENGYLIQTAEWSSGIPSIPYTYNNVTYNLIDGTTLLKCRARIFALIKSPVDGEIPKDISWTPSTASSNFTYDDDCGILDLINFGEGSPDNGFNLIPVQKNSKITLLGWERYSAQTVGSATGSFSLSSYLLTFYPMA